ncbi:protein kinase domain containing protein [Gracilaria domingensis]|nr:protein kinase domain containing protein [Gracilaria domingensis]
MFNRPPSRHHRPHTRRRRSRSRSRSRSRTRATRATRGPPARSLSPTRRRTRSRSRSVSSGSPPDSLSGASSYSHIGFRSPPPPPFMRRSLSFTGLHEDPFPFSRASEFPPFGRRRSRSRSPRSRVRSASVDRVPFDPYEPRFPFERRRAFDDFPLRFDERPPPFDDPSFDDFEPPFPPRHRRGPHFFEDQHMPHFPDQPPRFSMDRAMRFPARTPNIVFMQPRSFVFNVGTVADSRTPWLQVMDEFDGRRVLYATGNYMQRSSHVRLHDDYSGELLRLSQRKSSSKSRRYASLRVVTFNKYRDPVMTAVSMRDAYGPQKPQGAGPPPFSYAPNANQYYPPQGAYPYPGAYPVPPYGAPGPGYPDMQPGAPNAVPPEVSAPQPTADVSGGPYSAPWPDPQQQPQGVPVYPQPDQSRQPGQEYPGPQPQYQQWQGMYYQPSASYPNQTFPQGYNPGMYANYMYGFGHQNNVGRPPFQPWESSNQIITVAEFFSGEKSMDDIRRSRRDGRRRHPLFKLARSGTGEQEWIQTSTGRELASITYSTVGSDGFSVEGNSYKVVVQPGVDLTMITSAIVSRIIMWAGNEERF